LKRKISRTTFSVSLYLIRKFSVMKKCPYNQKYYGLLKDYFYTLAMAFVIEFDKAKSKPN